MTQKRKKSGQMQKLAGKIWKKFTREKLRDKSNPPYTFRRCTQGYYIFSNPTER